MKTKNFVYAYAYVKKSSNALSRLAATDFIPNFFMEMILLKRIEMKYK